MNIETLIAGLGSDSEKILLLLALGISDSIIADAIAGD